MFAHGAGAAVRDGGAAVRAKSGSDKNTQRLSSSVQSNRPAARTSVLTPRATTNNIKSVATRSATARASNSTPRTTSLRTTTPSQTSRVVARATDSTPQQTPIQTRTGAEYEKCKTAYFTCMDQFCALKNDDYRRCSCSNRIYDFADARDVLNQAGEQLTVFTENLDVVGMTAAQATAMKTASEGESALTADTSASKALLQAIMNSIRGKDSTVGGKYTELNSINISFDTANAFGTMDAGQAVAMYNGQNLYSAVYPQCRAAVRADCNDAALQRAITAYLMAIEQDCNTVQTAIENTQKEMKSAVREGSAMLDLARVENRKKHNSSDIPTCIADVESAILSEQVCGDGYHKCLDNGEFIDIATGAPIAGVADFYKLEELLTFADGVDAADQKLSKIPSNRTFVANFENRTKKFAQDALDKCVEDADIVWAEYLDKALLDIYYAQRAKVDIIKQGCFDFVSTCYMNGDDSMTAAMKELTGDDSILLQPNKIALTGAVCTDYVKSCNNMFKGDIVAQYIAQRQDTDTLTACRAIAKQCFDTFGGTNYENFYYPYSGLFTPDTGNAPDWFTLYEVITQDAYNNLSTDKSEYFTLDKFGPNKRVRYKSACAKQLAKIDSCNTTDMIERAFGGFDKMYVSVNDTATAGADDTSCNYIFVGELQDGSTEKYGTLVNDCFSHRILRNTGVATETYNQVVDILTTQCTNLQGRFIELQFGASADYDPTNMCLTNFGKKEETTNNETTNDTMITDFSIKLYGVLYNENMCPRDYILSVDTKSWGACICWENGGRRSKNGTSAKCISAIPVASGTNDTICTADFDAGDSTMVTDPTAWCTRDVLSSKQQVCPIKGIDDQGNYTDFIGTQATCNPVLNGHNEIPEGLSM